MVSANCRKNVPVIPLMNAVGIKTEQSTSAIATNFVVESGRKTLLELSHFFPDGIGSRERVRTGKLENCQRGRRFSAELAVDRVIARRQFHPPDIAHTGDLSVGASFNDNITE